MQTGSPFFDINKIKFKKTIIVAGITRSGLTLTMKMLDAGGFPCLGTYPAYEDKEYDKINYKESEGKAIKIVDIHQNFPPTGNYHVILLKRNQEEQSKSIVKFLRTMGIPVDRNQARAMQKSLPGDYRKIDAWAKRQAGYMELHFENIINDPLRAANMIVSFIDVKLDTDKMVKTVIPRSVKCYPTMLELTMIRP